MPEVRLVFVSMARGERHDVLTAGSHLQISFLNGAQNAALLSFVTMFVLPGMVGQPCQQFT